MNRSLSLLTLTLASSIALSGCKNETTSTNSPDTFELEPEREVADKTSKPKVDPKPTATKPKDEKVAAHKVEPTKPGVTTPQDRDQNAEKAKMKRSREKSGKAKQFLRAGSLDKAITQARDALREHEQNVEAMLVIAECFYKQHKHELVISVTVSILKVDPKVLSPEEKSQAYNLMAFAYLQSGQRVDAFNSFKSAAETDEHNSSAWNNLGVQYMWKGDTATAETCFQYAVSLDAKFYEAQLNYGARATGQRQAERRLRPRIATSPSSAPTGPRSTSTSACCISTRSRSRTTTRSPSSAPRFKEFETYKSLVSKGTTSVERRKSQRGPTDAMGNELVSVAQADLYIKSANKSIESEQRRQERDAKRKAKDDEAKVEEAAASAPEPEEEPADIPVGPAKPQKPGEQPPPVQPSKPTPAQPTPAQPAPAQPTPTQPAKPTPAQPTPAQPTPAQPSKPTPVQPSKPTSTQPAPTQPAPDSTGPDSTGPDSTGPVQTGPRSAFAASGDPAISATGPAISATRSAIATGSKAAVARQAAVSDPKTTATWRTETTETGGLMRVWVDLEGMAAVQLPTGMKAKPAHAWGTDFNAERFALSNS